MKLINDFYTIEQQAQRGVEVEFTVRLNREHFIYRAHFPDNPVTPGVCIIQMCQELLELHVGKKLTLKKVVSVKFLSVINPDEISVVDLRFAKVEEDEAGYKISAQVCHEATPLTKLSLYFQKIVE
jgi:3-hydroxyacyl-[acyl-carrier-protein] dehydratase